MVNLSEPFPNMKDYGIEFFKSLGYMSLIKCLKYRVTNSRQYRGIGFNNLFKRWVQIYAYYPKNNWVALKNGKMGIVIFLQYKCILKTRPNKSNYYLVPFHYCSKLSSILSRKGILLLSYNSKGLLFYYFNWAYCGFYCPCC